MQIVNSFPVTYIRLWIYSTTNLSADLEVGNEEKDLDVWYTSDLKPSLHCQRAAAKASQVLGLIKKSFWINFVNMLVLLYKMCMYALTWSTVYKFGTHTWPKMDILEKVQRCATKCLRSLAITLILSMKTVWKI